MIHLLLFLLFCPLGTLTRVVFQNKLGDTALHAASWKGHCDILHLLLKIRKWQNCEGQLHEGLLCIDVSHMVHTLSASGARTDLRNNENKLALDMATNAQCASLLKKAEAGSKYSRH